VAGAGRGARANRVDPQLLGQLVAEFVAIHTPVVPKRSATNRPPAVAI
jgi:hypothetical protein